MSWRAVNIEAFREGVVRIGDNVKAEIGCRQELLELFRLIRAEERPMQRQSSPMTGLSGSCRDKSRPSLTRISENQSVPSAFLVLFAQDGSSISGCYDWDQGSLSGNLDGRVIQFEWRENGGQQIGAALMVLSSTGDQLNGLWYEKGAYRGFWVGSRAAPGERPSPVNSNVRDPSRSPSGRAVEPSFMAFTSTSESDRLRSDSETTLQEVQNVMERQPELALIVEGHTDSTGEAAYNQDLSRRRARSVVTWLVEQGIDSGRLEPQGYGEDRPVAGNETAQGRALNRRVELKQKP